MLQSNPKELEQRLYPIELSKPKTTFGGLREQILLPKVMPKVIPNPVIDCNMPPYPEECILRANNPDPSNDFIDAVVPQTLRDPLIDLPSFFPTNPPFLPPPRNESFIAPMPFIDFDTEKKDFNIPIIIGLILLGYFIIK